MHYDALKFVLSFKCGYSGLGLVAVAEYHFVKLGSVCLPCCLDLEAPLRVIGISKGSFHGRVEYPAIESVEVLRIVLHVLLELI